MYSLFSFPVLNKYTDIEHCALLQAVICESNCIHIIINKSYNF